MYNMAIDIQAIEQNIHALGVSYIYGYLDREGYTIYEVNTDPLHHFQILAKRDNHLIIVAVRTAYHPDFGAIDKTIQQQLFKESKRLDAIPHVACLAVTPLETNDLEIEGLPEGTDYQVTFNGLKAL
jgi:hypothetical protein